MMNICADCRVDIKYKKKGNVAVPVIGTDESFGTKGGNRVSKTNTISFRGAANTKLAEFGTIFKLEPSEDNGIFYLVGDKNPTIDSSAINIEKEFDLTALEEFDLEDDCIGYSCLNCEKCDFLVNFLSILLILKNLFLQSL